jgi:hypothetical protein
MASSKSRNLVQSCTLALLGLVAAGAFAPSRAQAGCVLHAGRHVDDQTTSAHFELLPVSEGPGSPETPLDSPARRSPCPGGMCTPAPSFPASTTPKAPSSIGHWPCLTTDTASPGSETSSRLTDDPDPRPVHRLRSLERPPRLSAPPAP